MSLSDSFPENLKAEFARRNLKIGAVVRVHVKDTNPPKEKRFILVGQSFDKLIFATIFINSEINSRVFSTQDLRDLNLELSAKGRPYLSHDSYADCSNVQQRTMQWLLTVINDDPDKILGEISEKDLKDIREKIKFARTITPKIKKIFGLFL